MAARGIRKKRLVSAGSDSILFSWKSAAPPRTDHRGTGQYLFVLGCLQVVLGLYRSKNLRAMGRVSVRCSGTSKHPPKRLTGSVQISETTVTTSTRPTSERQSPQDRVVATSGEIFSDGTIIDLTASAGGGRPDLLLWKGKRATIAPRITYGGWFMKARHAPQC